MYDITVGFDLVKIGITEDGEDAISHRYYVQAEAADGRRWVHHKSFDGSHLEADDDTGAPCFVHHFEEAEAQARSLADKMLAHLRAGGALNFDHWHVDRPAYGSQAYSDLDEGGYFAALERMDEGFSPMM